LFFFRVFDIGGFSFRVLKKETLKNPVGFFSKENPKTKLESMKGKRRKARFVK
jgi:hypothetical protein